MSITGAWSGKGLLISLIIGFIAVESIVAAGFLSLLHFKTSANWVSQSQHVLLELERMISTVTGAETNQRAYLITGSDDYLPPTAMRWTALTVTFSVLGALLGVMPSSRTAWPIL